MKIKVTFECEVDTNKYYRNLEFLYRQLENTSIEKISDLEIESITEGVILDEND